MAKNGAKPAKRYESSVDFTNDFADATNHLHECLRIMEKLEMANHVKDTKANFGVDCGMQFLKAKTALANAKLQMDNFDEKMATAE